MFDTSNIAGSDFVAAKVTFICGKYEKKRNRVFKIEGVVAGDDGAGLYQAVQRRLVRGKGEQDLPDFILVDGGKAQLSSACKALQEEGVHIDIASMAKEKGNHSKGLTQEKIFLPGRSDPLMLPYHCAVLLFLQRIRDEAHRVAVAFHRKKRLKRTLFSEIDTVLGIGPHKKKKLLQAFGSYQQILQASDAALRKVPGITEQDIDHIRHNIKKS